MSVTGVLTRVDIGMGAWVVETADGERVQLLGPVNPAHEGRVVEATGQSEQAFTTSMLDVTAILRITGSPRLV